jgi:hypothetical protein
MPGGPYAVGPVSGYRPAPAGYPPMQTWGPPRRRSNPAPVVLAVILVVVLGGVMVMQQLGGRGAVADSGYRAGYTGSGVTTGATTTTSTTTYSYPTTSASAPALATPPPQVTTEQAVPTGAEPTERTQADTPTQQAPPPRGPRPVDKLGDNPLFEGNRGTAAMACALPRWHSDPASADQFFRAALPCLMQAWTPVLQAADLPVTTPRIESPSGTTWNSPCGTDTLAEGFAAFYCSADETLYMPFTGLYTQQDGAHPGVYLAVFAHEFGHHVQELSGVLGRYGTEDAGDGSAQALELSRRLELQAQCFSGMFFAAAANRGAVDANLVQEARTSQQRGDENKPGQRDHGTNAHTDGWWQQGFTLNSTAQCDTWLSAPGDVS